MHSRNRIGSSSCRRGWIVITEGKLSPRPRGTTDRRTDHSRACSRRTRRDAHSITRWTLEYHFDPHLAEHAQERVDAHVCALPTLYLCPQPNADSDTLRRFSLCETESSSCRSEHRSKHSVRHEHLLIRRLDSRGNVCQNGPTRNPYTYHFRASVAIFGEGGRAVNERSGR